MCTDNPERAYSWNRNIETKSFILSFYVYRNKKAQGIWEPPAVRVKANNFKLLWALQNTRKEVLNKTREWPE